MAPEAGSGRLQDGRRSVGSRCQGLQDGRRAENKRMEPLDAQASWFYSP